MDRAQRNLFSTEWNADPEPEEPAPAPSGRHILGVGELAAIIDDLLLDERLIECFVRGEVTNYHRHASGHRYFSLSEEREGESAVIPCVIWRRDAGRLGHELEDGQSVIAFGSIGNYAAGGVTSSTCARPSRPASARNTCRSSGGAARLGTEGCFQEFRKQGLPRYPARVGVVTSPTGAVLHDIMNVLRRRFPVELVLSLTAVQGDGAEARDCGRDPAGRRDGRRDHRRARRRGVRGPLRLQPSGRRPGGLRLRDADRLGRRARGRRDPLRPRGRPPCPHAVGRGRGWLYPIGPCSSRISDRRAGGSWTCCTGGGSRPTTRSANSATGSGRRGSHSGLIGGARSWPSSTRGSDGGATGPSSAGGPNSRDLGP